MHPIDWLIVLLLNGSAIGLGFYLSRGNASSSDWFLGGRALPWWAIGLSMFATNIDNAELVAVTGMTHTNGLHIISVYTIGSAAGVVLAAFFVIPAMYRAGVFTNSEYLETRFGPTARVLSALIQIQYRTSVLGLMIWSVYLLLTGLEIVEPAEAWVLIVVMVVCAGAYTAWGGLKSVIWTDAVQGIVMMIGAAVIFLAVYRVVGGWSGLETALERAGAEDLTHVGQYDGSTDELPSPFLLTLAGRSINLGPFVVMLGWTIIACGYWTVNHTQTMRLMGARSMWDMKMAATAGIAIGIPIMIACACLGVFARAIPETAEMKGDQIYPWLVSEYLGVGLKGLVVAGVIAAAVSTFDSMGSALSAVFTRDIYARLLVKGRDDRHYVIAGRWATLGVLLIGFLYLPFILTQKNMMDSFTTLVSVFVTPLFTMYVAGALTRVSARSGIIGLIVGACYGLFALYCRETPSWLPSPDGVPVWFFDRWAAYLWSVAITATAMAVATPLTGRESTERQTEPATGWLRRSSEELPELRDHPFATSMPWWADPRLYAAALCVACAYIVFVLFW